MFNVVDMFDLPGRGVILTVELTGSEIARFDRLTLKSPQGSVDIDIAQIESQGGIVERADSGLVGLQPQPFKLDAVADGFRLGENGSYKIISLKVMRPVAPTKKSWQFWKK